MNNFLDQTVELSQPLQTRRMGGYVYIITNKITGDTYIGATIRPIKKRWKYHRMEKRRGTSALHIAMRQYKSENFSIEEIASAIYTADLTLLETDLIEEYQPTYNCIRRPDNIWAKYLGEKG